MLTFEFLKETFMLSPRNDIDLGKMGSFCAPGTRWPLIKAFNNKDADFLYDYHEMKENMCLSVCIALRSSYLEVSFYHQNNTLRSFLFCMKGRKSKYFPSALNCCRICFSIKLRICGEAKDSSSYTIPPHVCLSK